MKKLQIFANLFRGGAAVCSLVTVFSINSAEAATLIQQAVSASTDLGERQSTTSVANMINQSGLNITYTSGDDLNGYLSQNPLHTTLDSGNDWASSTSASLPGVVDYNLGRAFSLTDVVLWNDEGNQGIQNFNLIVSTVPDFSSSTTISSFTASFNSNTDYPAQRFTFSPIEAQYIRLGITSNYGASVVSVGEIAFGVESQPVPEPMTILGTITALGFGAAFKRRQAKG